MPAAARWLTVYFTGDLQLAANYDAEAFYEGHQMIVASPQVKFPQQRVDDALLEPAEVRVKVRQKSGVHQLVTFRAPPAFLNYPVTAMSKGFSESCGKRASMQASAPQPYAQKKFADLNVVETLKSPSGEWYLQPFYAPTSESRHGTPFRHARRRSKPHRSS